MQSNTSSILFAFVGMPGSGESEAATYLKEKGMAYIRFGDVTEEGLRRDGLPLTPENERVFREAIRAELGMAAYAIRSEEKLKTLAQEGKPIVIDGLYSWEEYLYLAGRFSRLVVIYVFARPEVRYERLMKRATRPLTNEEARKRDIAEIEKLNKSGPIAIADFVIDNSEAMSAFYEKIDAVVDQVLQKK
jgi:dephospho-CoA kinase